MGHADTAERLFLQASPGLEEVLAVEASALGCARRVAGGVELDGPAGVHADANLVSRVAERVLLRLVDAPHVTRWSEALDVLGGAAGASASRGHRGSSGARLERTSAPWMDAVASPGTAVVLESTVRLPGAPRSSQGVAEALARVWGRPVSLAGGADREGDSPRLVLRAAERGVQLSADTSGALLYRRGWRQEVSRAPMRETLAAGVLALAGRASTEPLWDPMCGSGTLVIEGALASRKMAPGLGRRFAAEAWPVARSVNWETRRRRLESAVLASAPAAVVGTDVNAGSLGTARRNARRAGVLEDVRLERLDIAAATPGAMQPGLLVANVPYGIRVGERRLLGALDTALARVVSGPFAGWRLGLLVDDARRLERLGRGAPDAVHALRNGGIPVVLGLWESRAGSG